MLKPSLWLAAALCVCGCDADVPEAGSAPSGGDASLLGPLDAAPPARPPTDPPPDFDGDGVPDAYDNCPAHPNPEQRDADGDGLGDRCDGDIDGDGASDQEDCDPFDPEVGARMDEVCNGLDDDCDRRVDEGALNACGKCGPVPLEQCDGRDRDCDGRIDEGLLNACGACGPLPDEVCDGLDDDCDGRIDEGLLNACGACGPVPPEVCDGDDDDCDGRVDEGLLNACGACGPLPPEVCDGDDDDCDGRIDEGLLNRCGGCGAQPVELCDGDDDDCDGRIDEGLLNACGGCGPAPVEACNQLDDDCDGQVDEGPLMGCGCDQPEACDGLDNDCDGQVDEGVLNACGVCGQAPDEVCDGVDDDCDGQVDEGLLNACGACGDVPPEACNGEDDDCDGAVDEGALNACGACGEAPDEACNGVDDDCDGRVDEVAAAEACERGLGECAAAGVLRCWGARWVCDARQGPAADEACNGLDDDCDGLVDEGVVNACGECAPPRDEVCDGEDNDCDGEADEDLPVGAECVAGVGRCANDGRVRCVDGAWRCAAVQQLPQAEWCNGEDDDCDGATDEGLLNACGVCGPAPVEVCDGADQDCDGRVDEGTLNPCGGCGPVPAERCDRVDEDCDGRVDEGACDGACLGNHAGGSEWCNGVDDDGDGRVDGFVFGPRRLIHQWGAVRVFAVDFLGNRHPDLVSLAVAAANPDRPPAPPVAWLQNDGDGAFVACAGLELPVAEAVDGAAGDVTGDGLEDLVIVLDGAVHTLTAAGGVVERRAGPRLAPGARIGLGDLDGDGLADLLVGSEGQLHWRVSGGDGTFGAAQALANTTARQPKPLAVDMDGDGALDVVAHDEQPPRLRWWRVPRGGPAVDAGALPLQAATEPVGPGKGAPFTVWQAQPDRVRACTAVDGPRCVDFVGGQPRAVRLGEIDARGAHHDVLVLHQDGTLTALTDTAAGYDGPVVVSDRAVPDLYDAPPLSDPARHFAGHLQATPWYGVLEWGHYEVCNGRDDDCDGRVDEGALACPGGRR